MMTTMILTVMHGDVSSLARLAMTFQPKFRKEIVDRIIGEAVIAKAHSEAHGKLHPDFGNGSIMAAARQYAQRNNRPLADEPFFDNVDYIDVWLIALNAIRVTVSIENLEAAA